MYLLGHHGNNLYPRSLRLFSDKAALIYYLTTQWHQTLKKFEEESRNDGFVKRFKTFEGYIKMISWRLYELPVDSDLEPRNIRSTTLAKWAKELEGR